MREKSWRIAYAIMTPAAGIVFMLAFRGIVVPIVVTALAFSVFCVRVYSGYKLYASMKVYDTEESFAARSIRREAWKANPLPAVRFMSKVVACALVPVVSIFSGMVSIIVVTVLLAILGGA